MIEQEKTFGSLVKQYIDLHDLSYQDLVDQLGYRSKTSISRIIQDMTSFQLRKQFYTQFSRKYPLTPEETSAFEYALNTSRLSDEHRALFSAYKQLFSPENQNTSTPPRIIFESIDNAETVSMPELIRRHESSVYRITALVFGLCFTPILQQLYATLDELNASFSIHHYLYVTTDAEPCIQQLRASSGFLFDPRYIPYHCQMDPSSSCINNLMLLLYENVDGTSAEELFLPLAPDRMLYRPLANSSLVPTCLHFIELNTHRIQPIKRYQRYASEHEQVEDFINAQKQLASLEADHSIYIFQKSLILALIPPEIFRDALRLNLLPEKQSPRIVDELFETQRRRYQNLRNKKAPTYLILSEDTVQNFVWTGRLRNHPFLLRPFSPRERASILNGILSLMEHNPIFFLRMSGEDIPSLWDTMDFACYQHIKSASSHKASRLESLRISPSNDFAGESASVSFSNPDIIGSFSLYYREELWKKHTLSPKKSIHFLRMMLQYLASKGVM